MKLVIYKSTSAVSTTIAATAKVKYGYGNVQLLDVAGMSNANILSAVAALSAIYKRIICADIAVGTSAEQLSAGNLTTIAAKLDGLTGSDTVATRLIDAGGLLATRVAFNDMFNSTRVSCPKLLYILGTTPTGGDTTKAKIEHTIKLYYGDITKKSVMDVYQKLIDKGARISKFGNNAVTPQQDLVLLDELISKGGIIADYLAANS